MKLKVVSILLIALAVLSLLGCSFNKAQKHMVVDAKGVSFESLEEMENAADAVLLVTRAKEEVPVIKYLDGERVYSAYTFSKSTIDKVLVDKTGTLNPGDSVRILENEAYDKKTNVVYHVGGYNMMKEGKKYLLFVSRHLDTDGQTYYVADGVQFGTISLEEDGRTSPPSGNGEKVDNSVYEGIWQEAKSKYLGG